MHRATMALIVFAVIGWGSAHAVLIDNGDGTVTDTSTGLMWLQDSTLKQATSWEEAKAWADSLTIGGYDDWRLPSALDSNGNACLGFDCTDTEFGSLFYGALNNTAGSLTNTGVFNIDPDNTWFWTATNSGQACGFFGCVDLPYFFKFETGEQSAGLWSVNPLNAWAVRQVTTTITVLEPPAWAMMGLGLALLALKHRRSGNPFGMRTSKTARLNRYHHWQRAAG